MKATFILTFVCLILSGYFSLHAQELPIDAKLRQCMDSDSSIAGMLGCYRQAENEWDKELNRIYQLLMSVLDEKSKKNLKTSQLAWIKTRDSEFVFLESFYGSLQGTMFTLFIANKRMVIVRSRAMELKIYYDDYQIHRE